MWAGLARIWALWLGNKVEVVEIDVYGRSCFTSINTTFFSSFFLDEVTHFNNHMFVPKIWMQHSRFPLINASCHFNFKPQMLLKLNYFILPLIFQFKNRKVSNMTATGGVYFPMCSAEQLQRCFGKQTAAITDIPGWAMNRNFSLFVNTSCNDPHGVSSDMCLSLKQKIK